MKRAFQAHRGLWLMLSALCLIAPAASNGADKLNTAYISTTPGSSTVIQVAKETKIFDKHGIDATVIFISGSVRGIQAILAGEIPSAKAAAPDWRARAWPAAM